MPEFSSTKTFLNWMYSTTFEDIPDDVRHTALLSLYDDIGCNLACSMLPLAHHMVSLAKLEGGNPHSSIIGFPMRTSIQNAAAVNGTIGHGDEIDCTDDTGQPRTMPALMAATLAAGQSAQASGQEVIRAVVFGHELTRRIHALKPSLSGMANDPIDQGHSMGCAVAAGIVLGLNPDEMDRALSFAATMVAGTTPPITRETEHMVKSFLRGGVGSRNGVQAALMAKVGFDGPRDIFDGDMGFFRSRLGIEEPGPEFMHGLGENYSIRTMNFKWASAGGPNQAPRLALLEVMSENGLGADDIEEILVEVRPGGYNTITSVHHPTIYGKTVQALAAVYGGIGFLQTHQEKYHKSSEVLALEERIKIQPKPEWAEYRHHGAVTVTTKDGRSLYKEGDWKRMPEENLDAKFAELVSLRVGEAKARELAQVLKRLDTASSIADIMTQLEFPEASINQV
jgi:2-methylcitrate dehydratase PrpD